MGTHSIIKFKEVDFYGKTRAIATIYQQFDGYLSGVGLDLCNWLLDKTIINGIARDISYNDFSYANGFNCLAAQYIRDHKKELGNLYMYPEDCDNEEYNYEVIMDYVDIQGYWKSNVDTVICLKITDINGSVIIEGSPSNVKEYILAHKDD